MLYFNCAFHYRQFPWPSPECQQKFCPQSLGNPGDTQGDFRDCSLLFLIRHITKVHGQLFPQSNKNQYKGESLGSNSDRQICLQPTEVIEEEVGIYG